MVVLPVQHILPPFPPVSVMIQHLSVTTLSTIQAVGYVCGRSRFNKLSFTYTLPVFGAAAPFMIQFPARFRVFGNARKCACRVQHRRTGSCLIQCALFTNTSANLAKDAGLGQSSYTLYPLEFGGTRARTHIFR